MKSPASNSVVSQRPPNLLRTAGGLCESVPVKVQPAVLRLVDFLGFVFAEGVDVAVDIALEKIHALVRALEHHEAAEREGDVPVRNPAGHVLVGATAHVGQVAVRVRALAGADRAEPGEIVVPYFFAEELG